MVPASPRPAGTRRPAAAPIAAMAGHGTVVTPGAATRSTATLAAVSPAAVSPVIATLVIASPGVVSPLAVSLGAVTTGTRARATATGTRVTATGTQPMTTQTARHCQPSTGRAATTPGALSPGHLMTRRPGSGRPGDTTRPDTAPRAGIRPGPAITPLTMTSPASARRSGVREAGIRTVLKACVRLPAGLGASLALAAAAPVSRAVPAVLGARLILMVPSGL